MKKEREKFLPGKDSLKGWAKNAQTTDKGCTNDGQRMHKRRKKDGQRMQGVKFLHELQKRIEGIFRHVGKFAK
jgi:hypothetical protein